jgi:hypothetical protein
MRYMCNVRIPGHSGGYIGDILNLNLFIKKQRFKDREDTVFPCTLITEVQSALPLISAARFLAPNLFPPANFYVGIHSLTFIELYPRITL